MVTVADQVIALQHGGFVATKVVDRGAFAAKLGLVQHIVVNQCRHVHHLDDGGERDQGVAEFFGRCAGLDAEEYQTRAEHFAAESADVLHQCIDTAKVAVQLFMEAIGDGGQFGSDTVCQTGQRGGYYAPWHAGEYRN